MIEIIGGCMSLAIGDRIIATARISQHAAADGRSAWIASRLPNRLLTRNQAITALTVTELLTAHLDHDGLGPQARGPHRN